MNRVCYLVYFLTCGLDIIQNQSRSTPEEHHRIQTLILDAIAEVQSMKRSTTTSTLKDLITTFDETIDRKLQKYDEGRIVFDWYMELSLKNKTRSGRAKTSTDYLLHPDMKLTMTVRELLSSTKTKRKLTNMLPNSLIEHFRGKQKLFFVIQIT